MWRYGPDPPGLGWDPLVGSCEHGNEPSGSMKVGGFLSFLNDCQLSEVDCAA
jgi:hypothetical protein